MESASKIGETLRDPKRPLKDRFRALFTLRNLGGEVAVNEISSCFSDESALLKHELAYCLGQMQNPHAIPRLIEVLKDETQDVMVRHEAGEALGAIGDMSAYEILQQYSTDPLKEIAETCQLAIGRLMWLKEQSEKDKDLPNNPYLSVDPTPPAKLSNIDDLKSTLLNEDLSLFDRYRAMFTLRNIGEEAAVLALAEGLGCSSALFRHEVAYVLGQVQSPAATQQLAKALQNPAEAPMVRHECAEALGAIATPEANKVLEGYLQDTERVVRESAIVALDMSEHEQSGSFQYADTLTKIKVASAIKAD